VDRTASSLLVQPGNASFFSRGCLAPLSPALQSQRLGNYGRGRGVGGRPPFRGRWQCVGIARIARWKHRTQRMPPPTPLPPPGSDYTDAATAGRGERGVPGAPKNKNTHFPDEPKRRLPGRKLPISTRFPKVHAGREARPSRPEFDGEGRLRQPFTARRRHGPCQNDWPPALMDRRGWPARRTRLFPRPLCGRNSPGSRSSCRR
jgi:hypothetical protein